MFPLLNASGRAALEVDDDWYDLGRLSGDEFGEPDVGAVPGW